jgi:hypothetical protein
VNTIDKELCEAVLSPGKAIGRESWVKVMRADSLLLALPMQRDLALETLGLYQPQKWKGRCLEAILRVIIRMGIHRFLPKLELELGDKGLFSTLDSLAPRSELGFLLSSSDSEVRNLIGVYKIDGELCVVKAGCGEAEDVVRREYDAMQRQEKKFGESPSCKGLFDIESGVIYVAELIRGRSPRGASDDRVVFTILKKWLDGGEKKKVSTIDCWKVLEAGLDPRDYERIRALADMEVVSAMMHGDFTPWNIKITDQNMVRILDWEYSEPLGMPGWDWLHYHVQRMSLVQEVDGAALLESCMKQMMEPAFSAYLSKAGLSGSESILLESYLLYSGCVGRLPREKLLKALRNKEM